MDAGRRHDATQNVREGSIAKTRLDVRCSIFGQQSVTYVVDLLARKTVPMRQIPDVLVDLK